MSGIVLGLGSNLGDRAANLCLAVELLAERGIETLTKSSIWKTLPVPPDQPAFFNACIEVSTNASAVDILDIVKEIEFIIGRRPAKRWGPRPIDIDILLFHKEIINSEKLTVPHAYLSSRPFVLLPLNEICEYPIPGLNLTVPNLLSELKYAEGVEAIRLGIDFCNP
tara:strand:- start:15790 stop:16290 length:501 start_codon:yes stop_codon:yes gene_type:complete